MPSFETEILNEVIEKGEINYTKLAKKFKKTKSAAYAAVKRLRSKKILLGISPKIDLAKFGYDFTAFLLAKANPKNIPALVEEYAKQGDVVSVYEVSGEFDLLLVCKLKSTKQLYAIVNQLSQDERIAGVDTHIAYTTFKEGLNPHPLGEEP